VVAEALLRSHRRRVGTKLTAGRALRRDVAHFGPNGGFAKLSLPPQTERVQNESQVRTKIRGGLHLGHPGAILIRPL